MFGLLCSKCNSENIWELKSLVRAAGERDCRDLLVITWDLEGEEEFKGRDIRFVPLWQWLQG
jgi:predicted AAA+ superfamily ATPase